jgi:hypothetical protein
MAAWFATQGPSLSNIWTMSSRRPSPSGVAVLRSAREGITHLVASLRALSSYSVVGAPSSRRSSQSECLYKKRLDRLRVRQEANRSSIIFLLLECDCRRR